MASEDSKVSELNGIQVCVRVRPLTDREREAGYRNCIAFDEATQQVVLSAVDRNTLLQLRGQTAKGYAFDRRYGPEHTSDNIYNDCVCQLVDNLFKGYNGTVLAYGQTGSGKTLTMSGGQGIYGNVEKGIIRQAAEQILRKAQAVRSKQKPGESIAVKAYALELYNEELRDLSNSATASQQATTDADGSKGESAVRISERPYGKDGKCIPEIVGVNTVEVRDAESLVSFFADCFENRAVGATKMNDRSSRSHAIYTVLISRTLVDVSEANSKVRTEHVESRFNLVDLAGSERVKRSGVTGAAFKEAVHINGGLLALGNVIVALSGIQDDEDPKEGQGERPSTSSGRTSAKKHIPYRDSKLTRLLQDSLGGTALTILISCISACEADFEETNSTLKYANRACKIKNMPLQNKQLLLEEDLLPLLPANSPQTGNLSMMQMQLLLAEHNRMKEAAERREKEKKEKEEKRLAELRALKDSQSSSPGYQRLRMAQYDELRKKLASSHGRNIGRGEVIQDDSLAGFRKHGGSDGEASDDSRPTSARSARESRPYSARPQSARVYLSNRPRGSAASKAWASGDGARSGTPDVLVVEAEQEEEYSSSTKSPRAAPSAGVSARSRKVGKTTGQQPESINADVSQASSTPEPAGRHEPVREVQDVCLGSEHETVTAGVDLKVTVVESNHLSEKNMTAEIGTCMTPHADSIKTFCDADTANATATSGPPTASAGTNSASAFSVLSFQQQQQPTLYQEQPPSPAHTPPPQLLARFKVNQQDTLAVFKAVSTEDFADVAGLLPPDTALPAADKMTYLLARLEVHPYSNEQLAAALDSVAAGACGIGDVVGPAVGCLMATFGTSLITDCIFDFEDPEQLQDMGLQQRLELWGLQIPHNPIRPTLQPDDNTSGGNNSSIGSADNNNSKARVSTPDLSTPRRGSSTAQSIYQASQSTARYNSTSCAANSQLASSQGMPLHHHQQQQPEQQQQSGDSVTCWSSTDRLNVSIGLMYALCNLALEVGAVAGFCVPRPQLLRRWLQSGVKMRQVSSPTKLIYPPSAHDYAYYKSSTVAYFLIDEVRESLTRVLSNAQQVRQQQALA